MKRFLLTACLTTLLGLVFFQSQVCAEVPAFAGNVTQEEWDAYAQWFETLPPEQKDWEELLQKNLGPGFYFPIYLKGRTSEENVENIRFSDIRYFGERLEATSPQVKVGPFSECRFE